MNARDKEIQEKICVERFLNWYSAHYSTKYIYEKATHRFPDLRGGDWDFVVYEDDNRDDWIAIEVKELQSFRKISIGFNFWERLCSDLTRDLESKGIQGEFQIMFPPSLRLPAAERQRLVQALSQVLIDKQSGWRLNEPKDIGPDVASRFLNWPKERSDAFDEYDKWGTERPCRLEVKKVSASGCKVRALTSRWGLGDVVEEDKKAIDEVFELKNGRIHADKQLELAQTRGARKTILLLANVGVDEGLTREFVHNLAPDALSHIDCVYLVDMGNNGGVTKICP